VGHAHVRHSRAGPHFVCGIVLDAVQAAFAGAVALCPQRDLQSSSSEHVPCYLHLDGSAAYLIDRKVFTTQVRRGNGSCALQGVCTLYTCKDFSSDKSTCINPCCMRACSCNKLRTQAVTACAEHSLRETLHTSCGWGHLLTAFDTTVYTCHRGCCG
jgi:hypothetical protein